MTSSQKNRGNRGFSLVEMIGVLAIIAILAVVIVPRVFTTISSSRITSAISSVNAIKSAVTEFAGRYGTVPTSGTNSRIDDLLQTAGYLEGRFTVKVGTQPSNPPVAGSTWTYTNGVWAAATGGSAQTTQTRVVALGSTTATPGVGTNFRLNGTTDLPAGSRVISAVIAGVTGAEAREMSLRVDGDGMSQATATTADTTGKVTYVVPNTAGTTTVYIYVAHQ